MNQLHLVNRVLLQEENAYIAIYVVAVVVGGFLGLLLTYGCVNFAAVAKVRQEHHATHILH
jgi:hypothetical protein